jgi:membrane protease YdiL (CAAX protease family)
MQRKTSILTFSYTSFLILLFLSGSLTGIFSEIVYYLAFAFPIAISLYLTRGDGVEKTKYLTIDDVGVKRFLPLIFPTISAIIIISIVTSILIYNLSGKTNDVDVGDSLIIALLTHALLPAVLEEAIFRYLPMRLLAPHSPRAAIIISAFFFSLAHADLFTIPYALVAGVLLMLIDLMTDSVVPSVVIHFINNALSVSMIFMEATFAVFLLYTWIMVATILSLIVLYNNREDYEDVLVVATFKGEGVKFTPGMILFAALTLAIAIMNLLL